MADVTDILLKETELDRVQEMHHENQRAAMTNMILVITAAAFGFVAQRGLDHQALAVTIPLIGLGLYGALASAKFYERFHFHARRAYLIRQQLDELNPGMDLQKAIGMSAVMAKDQFKVTSRVRLHILWKTLHLSIAAAGALLTVIALLR